MNKVFIESASALNSISFWSWQKSTKCTFSLVDGRKKLSHRPKKSFYSRVQIKGLLFHELLEAYVKGLIDVTDYNSFLKELKRFENSYREKFDFSSQNLSSWSEVLDIFDYLADHSQSRVNKGGKTYFEEEVIAGKLLGRPDLYVVENNVVSKLYEFKSGSLFRDGSLKEEYLNQVHFYAYLLKEAFGSYPSKVILNSLVEGDKPILLDEQLCNSIAENAFKNLSFYNQEAESKTIAQLNDVLAKPNIDVCRFCNLRPFCKKFEDFSFDIDNSEEVFSFNGLISKITGSDTRYSVLDIVLDVGNSRVINVPSNILKMTAEGSLITGVNFKKMGTKVFQYSRNSRLDFYE